MNPQPLPDRHARWSVRNVQEAIGQDLRDAHGFLTVVHHSHPWVVVIDALQRLPIDSAVNLAAHLNHIGALPQAEHDALQVRA